MVLALLAFLGGALTIISPCILPVLPFVFARNGQSFSRTTVPLLAGMALTFAALAPPVSATSLAAAAVLALAALPRPAKRPRRSHEHATTTTPRLRLATAAHADVDSGWREVESARERLNRYVFGGSRVGLYRLMAERERRRGNDLLYATYWLRVMRL